MRAPRRKKREGSAQAVAKHNDGVEPRADLDQPVGGLRREGSREPLAFEAIRQYVSHGATALVRLAFPDAAAAEFELLRKRFLEIYRGRLSFETRGSTSRGVSHGPHAGP
jgi:hypothetical protein